MYYAYSQWYVYCVRVHTGMYIHCQSLVPTKAYSDDIRWRMVYQTKVLERSYCEVARNLNVDVSTMSTTVALFDETGNVAPKSYPPNPGSGKLR